MRRGFRTDVLRLGERNVPMVLDDKAVEAGLRISASVGERALVDRLDPAACDIPAIRAKAEDERRRSARGSAGRRCLAAHSPRSRDGRRVASLPMLLETPERGAPRISAISCLDRKGCKHARSRDANRRRLERAASASLQPQPRRFGGDQSSAEDVARADRVDRLDLGRLDRHVTVGRQESCALQRRASARPRPRPSCRAPAPLRLARRAAKLDRLAAVEDDEIDQLHS